MNINYLKMALVPIAYFAVSWFFPWDIFNINTTISIEYIFDIVFVVSIYFLLKKKVSKELPDPQIFVIKVVVVAIIAFACIKTSQWIGLISPFKYVDQIFIQLLILAPIIEELVFRGAFYLVSERYHNNKKFILFANSILFSLSHAPAFFVLPVEFHSFIWFQLFYTLILGWICTNSRMRTGSLIEPISLHFVFNLIFYFAITNQLI